MRALKKLDSNRGRRKDSVPPIIFKTIGSVVSTSSEDIFNNIKRLRKFPTAWEIGNVCPIIENEARKEVSINRPVTLLNMISKAFEELIFRAITEASVTTIRDNQYRFQPGRFVVVQLLYGLAQFYSNVGAAHSQNVLVLLDFSNAFDKIHNSQILAKRLQLDISKGLF